MFILIATVVSMTIVFGLVLFFLKKLLYSDTESSVNRLVRSYEEMEKKKAELTQKLAEIEQAYAARKEEAEKIASQIKDKAAIEAQSIMDSAFKKAKVEGEEIITNAQRKVDNIHREAQHKAELRVLEFCGAILKRVFQTAAREQIHATLLGDFIEGIKQIDTSRLNSEIKDVEIISFQKLSNDSLHTITTIITEKMGRPVTLTEKIDEALLGGLMLKLGGLVLDNSLANKITEASVEQRKLMEEAL